MESTKRIKLATDAGHVFRQRMETTRKAYIDCWNKNPDKVTYIMQRASQLKKPTIITIKVAIALAQTVDDWYDGSETSMHLLNSIVRTAAFQAKQKQNYLSLMVFYGIWQSELTISNHIPVRQLVACIRCFQRPATRLCAMLLINDVDFDKKGVPVALLLRGITTDNYNVMVAAFNESMLRDLLSNHARQLNLQI